MQEVPTMCARELGLLDDGGVQTAMESPHRIYIRRVPSISVVLQILVPKMSDELGGQNERPPKWKFTIHSHWGEYSETEPFFLVALLLSPSLLSFYVCERGMGLIK